MVVWERPASTFLALSMPRTSLKNRQAVDWAQIIEDHKRAAPSRAVC